MRVCGAAPWNRLGAAAAQDTFNASSACYDARNNAIWVVSPPSAVQTLSGFYNNGTSPSIAVLDAASADDSAMWEPEALLQELDTQ